MAVKNAVYQVDNGVDFDEINFRTIAAQVICSDGITPSSADSLLSSILNSNKSVANAINNFHQTGLTSSLVSVKKTDGSGAAMCDQDNCCYIIYAQDMGSATNHLLGIAIKQKSALGDLHKTTTLHSNGLAFGASNSGGTQVINGAVASIISCLVVKIRFY